MSGVKYDDKKVRPELLPFEILWSDAVLYSIGARKYKENNWRDGFKFSRSLGALLRHAFLWAMGEDNDPDTGRNHLNAVRWNAACLESMQRRSVGEDDRYRLPQDLINQLRREYEEFVEPPEWAALKKQHGLDAGANVCTDSDPLADPVPVWEVRARDKSLDQLLASYLTAEEAVAAVPFWEKHWPPAAGFRLEVVKNDQPERTSVEGSREAG